MNNNNDEKIVQNFQNNITNTNNQPNNNQNYINTQENLNNSFNQTNESIQMYSQKTNNNFVQLNSTSNNLNQLDSNQTNEGVTLNPTLGLSNNNIEQISNNNQLNSSSNNLNQINASQTSEEITLNTTTESPNNESTQNNKKKKKNTKIIILVIIGLISIVAIVFLVKPLFTSQSNKINNNKTKNYLSNYENTEYIAVKNDEGKYGYIDLEGNQKSEFIYEGATDFYKGYARVIIDDKTILIDSKFNKTKDITDYTKYNKEHGVWIINGELLNSKFESISEYKNIEYSFKDVLAFSSTKESGLINYEGKLIYKDTGMIFFDTTELSNDYTVIEKDEKYGVISLKTGKMIVEYQDKHIDAEYNNNFVIDHNKTIFIANDKIIVEYQKTADINYVDEYNGILKIVPNYDGSKYYYEKTKEIFESIDEIYEKYKLEKRTDYLKKYGYSVFEQDGRYGIKKNNKIIIEPIYINIELPKEEEFEYAKQKNIEPVILEKQETEFGNPNYIVYNLKNNEIIFEEKQYNGVTVSFNDMPYMNFYDKVCNIFTKKCISNENTRYLSLTSHDKYVQLTIFNIEEYEANVLYFELYNKDMKKIYSYTQKY